MSKSYPGNFITGNPVTLSQTSNNGVWDLKDNYHATTAGTWQEADGIYEIPRSLRFRRSASALLSRTPASAGNRKTWTWSAWVKKSFNGSTGPIFCAGTGGNQIFIFGFGGTDDKLYIHNGVQGVSTHSWAVTTEVYRDTSAWYHFVLTMNTTSADISQRTKLYVNGVQQQLNNFAGANYYPSQNYETAINNTVIQQLGFGFDNSLTSHFDGYITEVNHIDGQALDPSYFGYTDSITGIWQPKKYTGGYGTNGFYLPFTENQTLRNLGRNFAGGTNFCPWSNSVNNWGNTNCTVTANSITAPDGTTTADTITANSTDQAYMRQDTAINMGISTYYTMSVYLKAGTATTAAFSDGFGTGAWVTVDLTNGTITGAFNPFGYQEYTMTSVGNGWYRVTNSFITHSGGDYNIGLRVDPGRTYGGTGANGASVHVWGAMINLGKTADAFVPNDVSTRLDSNWTTNNFSLTAGATYDSMVDSPTNIFTTANDTGGVVSGNYCTINPLVLTSGATITSGNLNIVGATAYRTTPGTIDMTSGKWYWENTLLTFNSSIDIHLGVCLGDFTSFKDTWVLSTANGWGYTCQGGYGYHNNTLKNISSSVRSAGDIIGISFDADNGNLYAYVNGVVVNSGSPIYTGLTSGPYFPFVTSGDSSGSVACNFGQRPFAYTPPAGFRSLNTTNIQALGTSAISNAAITPYKYFNTILYPGSQTTRSITGVGFKPDFVWAKSRNNAQNHTLFNSVVGPTQYNFSNSTSAETINAETLKSFDADGYTMGDAFTNESGYSYVSWNWKAGDTTVTNTAGTLTSQVRANPTTGFSIVSYTLNNTNFTVGHGLNAVPKLIIVKNRSAANNWDIYHGDVGPTKRLTFTTSGPDTNAGPWNNTAPTSTVFSQQASWYSSPSSSQMIAYCWAEIPGYSKFGSYTGNGSSDGPFVYLGFRPRWVMTKRADSTGGWNISDTSRDVFNVVGLNLSPEAANAESSGNSKYDITSNGFKIRSGSFENASGGTYIYMAFAEHPFALNNRAR